MALTWAVAASWAEPPNELHLIRSASFQKDQAQVIAFDNWMDGWNEVHVMSLVHEHEWGTSANPEGSTRLYSSTHRWYSDP